MIMRALSRREGVNLSKKGALYSSVDGKWRAACTISKRYAKGRPPYWYGYSEEWRGFLSQGEKSFLVLGCLDQDSAFAIPNDEIEKMLSELYKTPERHWHIVLEESQAGALELSIPNGTRVPLNKFEVKPDQ
jgi:hypothetical protein